MRKKLFLLLLLVACIALSGCALVVKDPVRDAQQVIVDVNGETVDKQTVKESIADYTNYMYSNYAQMYAMYGMSFDPKNIDTTGYPQQVIDNTVQELVLKQKFAALPELAFTEEDEKAIAEEAQKEYDQNIDQVKTMYLSDSGKEGDELTAAAQEYALKLDSRYTLDFVKEHVREEKMVEKLREYAIKDVAVTEDDIKAEFDSRVASAKENYESNLSSFGSSVNSNGTVYYRPAGYRYVKQILVGFPDDLKTAITDANSAKNTAQTAVNNAQKAVDDNVNALAAEGLTDEAKAELEAAADGLKTTLAEAQADLEQKTAAADKALAAAFEAIQPTLDEVKTKLAAGEDFEALMEQYNTDPGMKTEPGKTNGYAVCEGFSSFDPAFVTAAMGLEKIGDVSEPVKSDSYGYYIIRYQSDIEEGPVALEDVRSIVEPAALNAKQNNTYNDTVKKWTDEAKVKTYIDRLSN